MIRVYVEEFTEIGDHVLVRRLRIKGKHKLEDKWEEDMYVVIGK